MLDIRKPIVAINLTPLVDVSLVLVVIFMATAPMFMQSGIIVTSGEKKLGASVSSETPKPSENIVIRLEPGAIFLNEHPVAEEQLPALLRQMLAASEGKRVIVNPEREIKHGRVVRIMDIAKQAGGENIVILGKTQERVQKGK
jgi:biopolymer transport protein ExbD